MAPRWETLLDEASLRGVLPPDYVHFARPVRDGLAVFLGGLPEAQQAEILRAQAGLPVTVTFSGTSTSSPSISAFTGAITR